jgi:hypothetical protein
LEEHSTGFGVLPKKSMFTSIWRRVWRAQSDIKLRLSLGRFPNLFNRHLIWTRFQLSLIQWCLRNPHRPRNRPRLESPQEL